MEHSYRLRNDKSTNSLELNIVTITSVMFLFLLQAGRLFQGPLWCRGGRRQGGTTSSDPAFEQAPAPLVFPAPLVQFFYHFVQFCNFVRGIWEIIESNPSSYYITHTFILTIWSPWHRMPSDVVLFTTFFTHEVIPAHFWASLGLTYLLRLLKS